MKVPWGLALFLLLFLFACCPELVVCQDDGGNNGGTDGGDDGTGEDKKKRPKELDTCNGIFLTYDFLGREKEFPHVKNVTKQAWSFKAEASLTNVGEEELNSWNMYIGFQHREILVAADGAVLIDAGDFPAQVGNGTTLAGNPMTDLKTAIDTAGDFDKMSVRIQMKGTLFGVKEGTTPMPKTIKLDNDGFKCPAATTKGTLFS